MPRPQHRRIYLREWRKHRGLTLERLAGRLEGVDGGSVSSLSRLERGQLPYTQSVLEALAAALDCTPMDLISRLPGHPEEITLIWERLDATQKSEALAILRALASVRRAS